ncbi:hypothetical protein CR513_47751, partial [Mucuna pruriens]
MQNTKWLVYYFYKRYSIYLKSSLQFFKLLSLHIFLHVFLVFYSNSKNICEALDIQVGDKSWFMKCKVLSIVIVPLPFGKMTIGSNECMSLKLDQIVKLIILKPD